MPENTIVTKQSLKKEFSSVQRLIAISKPYLNRNCLLCDLPFPKKMKPKKTKQGASQWSCKKCGLVHYSVMSFPEILLVSPTDELKFRGLLSFQKQTLLYASDSELEKYNNGEEPVDEAENYIQKDKATMKKTNIGQSPIYDGIL